jgi:hypothetical protein
LVAFGVLVSIGYESAHTRPFDGEREFVALQPAEIAGWAPHGSHSEREEAPRSARAAVGYAVNSLTPWPQLSPSLRLDSLRPLDFGSLEADE